MLNTYFFADPDFLALLEFWETLRAGRALPDWDGDMAAFPRSLLPNLIISDRRGDAVVGYASLNRNRFERATRFVGDR